LRHPIQLQIANQKAENVSAFDLSPNPFTTQADFHVSLENAATAVLEIFTPDGRRVYAENFDLTKGTQLIRLTAESLPNGKMFFYRFLVNGEVFSGKMIRI
jgi:phosphodiesterase/alkaline phosphatase D-like protein